MPQEFIHKELSEAIIGAAMKVLNTLRPGLDEKLYERALVIELRKRGHKVDQRHEFPVYYQGEHIGALIPDLIVGDLVIVDPNLDRGPDILGRNDDDRGREYEFAHLARQSVKPASCPRSWPAFA